MGTVVAFTGHRPNKLGGYRIPNETYLYVREQLIDLLKDLKPETAISGMALGVDQWAACICVELDIPFVAAVPFKGQELAWPKESQDAYNYLLTKAERIETICEGGYAAWKMQTRNIWMCDNSDILIGVWDGSDGGTANCLRYATSKNKEVILIDPKVR